MKPQTNTNKDTQIHTPDNIQTSANTKEVHTSSPNIIPYMQDEVDNQNEHENVNKASIRKLDTNIELPYQICLSADPFDNMLDTEILTKISHATLGLELKHNEELGNRL